MGRAFLEAAAALGAAAAFAAITAAHAAEAPVAMELPQLDGSRFVRLSEFEGKAMLLNFWGSECPPCLVEMPTLFAMAARHENVQFLGIAVDQRQDAVRFLAGRGPTYPQLAAPVRPEVLLRRLGNPKGALPYTLVLDRSHRACRSHVGEVDAAWVSSAIAACGG
ncbi:MAG TPA: TlpA disulfide reductase family protein [Ramlibacter sp.]|uniref:TlpA family protein disulfide reductase n=1 Tax=Ramlibacter sp. TaxID=1917967 RepID=UPI002C86C986|nr:TlpA disulfide reductase family protein [Ramlibacter sp.]HVZ44501.1 TlpA disulfide reductase family protein [Ramlibacter sp.]